MAEVKKTSVTTNEVKFKKEQIIESEKYRSNRDLLEALLVDGETYSNADVKAKLEGFLKKKFK